MAGFEKILIYNCNIITPNRIIKDGSVLIENGIICDIINDYNFSIDAYKIDAKGLYLSPGFIDIHLHGGGGSDLMDGTIDAIMNIAKAHAIHGTTSILPTTLTGDFDDIIMALDNTKIAKERCRYCNILGVHLEGPYFSKEQKGAQDERFLKVPANDDYIRILDYSDEIKRVSAAPELDGALKLGNELRRRNILASIGHSNATYDEVLKAFDNGYSHVTHLYSGMSGVRRINAFRVGGVIESAFLIDDLTVEIIADGKHLPPELLKLIYKIKGPDRIALITDSMRAAGMPEGEYILGNLKNGQKVIVEDGVAKLMDRTAFAGSVATGDILVRNMINLAEVSLKEAIKMATITPAKIIGIDKKKGSISPGKDADLILFDDDINVKKVIVNGNIIF